MSQALIYGVVVALAVFFVGFFVLDVLVTLLPDTFNAAKRNSLIDSSIILTIGAIVVYGILDIVTAIFLLVERNEVPTILKAIAVTTLVQGICEVSVIFSPAGVFIFPLLLVFYAIYFLSSPERLEVV